jgi:sugar (pentulose or hexulose) kinase
MQVFGRAGTRLLPLLGDMQDLRAEARRLGITMSTQQSKAAAALGDAFDRVRMAVGAVANAVGDRPFQGVDRAVDHFCAVDGKPINMVWLRNGTTAMNAIVEMFGRILPAGSDPFAALMPAVLAAPDDCGGLAALPFMDDEPGLGVATGGTSSLIGLDATNATPGNAAKAMLLATIFNLRIGSDVLDAQGFPRTEIALSGGLVKTPALGQLVADAFQTPVVILDCGSEGSGFGAALLAAYSDGRRGGSTASWESFLDGHAAPPAHRFTSRPAAAATLERSYARHRELVAGVVSGGSFRPVPPARAI